MRTHTIYILYIYSIYTVGSTGQVSSHPNNLQENEMTRERGREKTRETEEEFPTSEPNLRGRVDCRKSPDGWKRCGEARLSLSSFALKLGAPYELKRYFCQETELVSEAVL